MHLRRIDHSHFTTQRAYTFFVRQVRPVCFSVLAGLCLVAAQYAHSQEEQALPAANAAAPANTQPEEKVAVDFASTPVSAVAAEAIAAPPLESMSAGETVKPAKQPVESEILFEGLASYGNYKIFASSYDMKLFTAGVEYDRHSFGHFLGAQMDYVAEFLPFVLLDKPLSTSIFGTPDPSRAKNIRQYVPGVGFSPIGFRWQWRSKKTIKPYLEAKGGIIAFAQKVPSPEASYENFSLQSGTGIQVRMSERWGLRLGLFSDFHFSNAFVVPVNPGLDVMNANLAISYHLGRQAQ